MIERIILTKPKKIPSLVIYNPEGTNSYRMINTKKGCYIGEMNINKRNKELFINFLHIKHIHRRQGYGTKFLNFARSMSYQMGKNGKLRTLSSPTSYDPNNPPHIFYRKFGFKMDDKKCLSEVDNAIKTGKQISPDYKNPRYMYYAPEKKSEQNKSIFEKLKSLF